MLDNLPTTVAPGESQHEHDLYRIGQALRSVGAELPNTRHYLPDDLVQAIFALPVCHDADFMRHRIEDLEHQLKESEQSLLPAQLTARLEAIEARLAQAAEHAKALRRAASMARMGVGNPDEEETLEDLFKVLSEFRI